MNPFGMTIMDTQNRNRPSRRLNQDPSQWLWCWPCVWALYGHILPGPLFLLCNCTFLSLLQTLFVRIFFHKNKKMKTTNCLYNRIICQKINITKILLTLMLSTLKVSLSVIIETAKTKRISVSPQLQIKLTD